MKKRVIFLGLAILMFGGNSIFAQGIQQTKGNYVDKFSHSDEINISFFRSLLFFIVFLIFIKLLSSQISC